MVAPGIVYLYRILPVAFLPSAATYLQGNDTASGWLPRPIFAAVLAQPFFFVLRILLDAMRRGAISVPQVPNRWPAGLDNVSKLGKMLESGYPADAFPSWFNEHGDTIMLNLLFENRAILATDFDNYWKGPVDTDRGTTLLGTGVFNTDGETTPLFHRSMTRPFFSRDRVSDFDIFDKHAHDAIGQAAGRLSAGHPVDIQDVASRFTLDSATEFLFGKSADSLSAGLAYPDSSAHLNPPSFWDHPSNVFVHAFMEGQRLQVDRGRFGSKWRLLEFWTDRIQPHRKIIDQFIDPIVDDALAKKVEGSTVNSEPKVETLLSHLLLGTDDRQIIRDEILNILVAGRDTTSATITFAVYMLAEHPEMATRLRNEILEKIGPSRRPTHEDMKTMPYLRAFINGPSSKKATTWPTPSGRPLYIPAATRIVYAVFLMHRRTDLWGPDALEFDPDRFMDERLHKYLTPNPYIFLPFNAGKFSLSTRSHLSSNAAFTTCARICLGQQFAYQESSFFLVRLLQRFSSFNLAPDAQPEDTKPPTSWKLSPLKVKEKITFVSNLTMFAKGGLWVRMEEAPKLMQSVL
ncbi:cytochrome P450 monooxygenase pc-3 [Mycena metata]|uniref:Cytochrome P450 monooxygenase pc-3 n=1 Tax=Mycena metata TaxID=1033252 RepID=A0AAD7HTR3_9AGAR|nr:cytochrome P450 monooxygenase pc-3 [Mycena metata]